jgi:hypothetical protein
MKNELYDVLTSARKTLRQMSESNYRGLMLYNTVPKTASDHQEGSPRIFTDETDSRG